MCVGGDAKENKTIPKQSNKTKNHLWNFSLLSFTFRHLLTGWFDSSAPGLDWLFSFNMSRSKRDIDAFAEHCIKLSFIHRCTFTADSSPKVPHSGSSVLVGGKCCKQYSPPSSQVDKCGDESFLC